MGLTKRESDMLARAVSRGYVLDRSQDGVPFSFSISPTVTMGVDTSVFNDLTKGVRGGIERADFRSNLNGIIIFPRILNPEIKEAKSLSVFKRSDAAYYVGRPIRYEQWQSANARERLALANENVLDSVSAIPVRHLPESDRKLLLSIVRGVITASGSGLEF